MVCLICSFLAFIPVLVIAIKIYRKLTIAWCRSQTCLAGKTAIVTGANTGIGYVTALDFAKRGARVILACRDEARAEDARAKIVEKSGNENVVVRLIDLGSFESVRAFAKKINEEENRLDILVNNAAALGLGDIKSEDGNVLLMQINHFSPVLLTFLLMGLMKKKGKSRIVNVSSRGAKHPRNFDPKNVNKFAGRFMGYPNSKLCNVLFTIELAKKLEGTGITTYTLHPGAVETEIFRHVKGFLKTAIYLAKNVFFKTCEEGAQTTIYCSVAKGIEKYNGELFENCQRVELYETARVPGLSKKLWIVTEDIILLKFDEILN